MVIPVLVQLLVAAPRGATGVGAPEAVRVSVRRQAAAAIVLRRGRAAGGHLLLAVGRRRGVVFVCVSGRVFRRAGRGRESVSGTC